MSEQDIPLWIQDQWDAASDQVERRVGKGFGLPDEYVVHSPNSGVIRRLGDRVMDALTGTCGHLDRPQPFIMVMAVRPAIARCLPCAMSYIDQWPLSWTEEHTCDACSTVQRPKLCAIQVAAGPALVVAGLCDRCKATMDEEAT